MYVYTYMLLYKYVPYFIKMRVGGNLSIELFTESFVSSVFK